MPSKPPRVRDILADPLSDIARKERRNLLLASVVGVFIAWSDIIPTRISTLGIELSELNQQYFLILLSLIVVYFLFAFVIYGVADFMIWRERYNEHLTDIEVAIDNISYGNEPDPSDPSERVPSIAWVYRWSKSVAITRTIFEYVLPIVLGCFSTTSLLLVEP